MDAERRTEIRRWAEGLERSEVAEVRAAGRALAMLVEENEELARRLARLELPEPSDQPPSAGATPTPRPPRRTRRTRKSFPWRLAGVLGGALLGAAVLTALAMAAVRPDLRVGGVDDGAVVGPTALAQLAFWARGDGDARAEWRLDGREVVPRRQGDRLVFRPRKLRDGEHVLEVIAGGPLFTATRR